jgi:hypothetical protein
MDQLPSRSVVVSPMRLPPAVNTITFLRATHLGDAELTRPSQVNSFTTLIVTRDS